MTMNLITGKAGAPHITSSDQGAMQAGLVGNGNYLLQVSDGKFPAVTMQSANKALVPVLNLVIEGRYARVTAAETVTIESGVTGRNRNDLICVKYTRDSNNIETIALAVLKGTATSGTAADPTVPSGSILNNSGTVWIPIARIPISGITAGTPVMLVKQLPPMSQLWDSVTQTCQLQWQSTGSFVGSPYGGGNIFTVKNGLIFVDLASFQSTVNVGNFQVWQYKSGIKPSKTVGLGCIANVSGHSYGKQANWNTDGSVTLIGGVSTGDIIQCFQKVIPVPDGVIFS
ncbi:hypothetical protein GBA80_05455 [Bifidobacterium catenulatum]|uniref:hypothetical protein n=2 Tax=Bifidobacterium TaxID=1678 RepID=UPI0012602D70|nr:hypothetical protein [Bifidobacterium catenulatum]KAB7463376.1 hypothetical protein GBA80_05455 [Bifidobacterium catenulatum]